MTIKKTRHFALVRTRGRYFVRAADKKSAPRGRRISAADVRYLSECTTRPSAGHNPLGTSEFDHACIMDIGVGVRESTREYNRRMKGGAQ